MKNCTHIFLIKSLLSAYKRGILTLKRYEFLANAKMIHNLIICDSQNPYSPSNLPMIASLPPEIQKNIFLVNIQNSHEIKTTPNLIANIAKSGLN